MMGIYMQQVWQVAKEIDSKLRATDPRLRGSVYLRHDDGSTLIYENAFLMRYHNPNEELNEVVTTGLAYSYPGDWILVFTEHHGFHVYAVDDLDTYRQYGQLEIENHPDFLPYEDWACRDCSIEFMSRVKCFCPQCKSSNVEKAE